MNRSYAAKALGGDVAGHNSVLCPGPGHSARDRSLSVTFTTDGDFIVFSHAGDNWRACRDYVRQRLGMGEFTPAASRPAPFIITPAPEDYERVERAAAIWRESRSIVGTPAEAHLTSRGVHNHGEAMRWHPCCPFGKGKFHGCMIALVRNIVTNEPQAIHRTAIDANGRKIDRKAYGPISGGAVKLTDDADVTKVIAIGEGIETALSIRELPDLSNLPVWSVLRADGISTFPVLDGIQTLWIVADNDVSGTGQNAARSARERMHSAGIETIVVASTQAGGDLNDWVARRA